MYNIYENNGYKDRDDYLRSLSDEYGVPLHVVINVADLLGEGEDFDGLLVALEDW